MSKAIREEIREEIRNAFGFKFWIFTLESQASQVLLREGDVLEIRRETRKPQRAGFKFPKSGAHLLGFDE